MVTWGKIYKGEREQRRDFRVSVARPKVCQGIQGEKGPLGTDLAQLRGHSYLAPCILPWYLHAFVPVGRQLLKGQGLSFRACVPEPSLVPSTWQTLNHCLQDEEREGRDTPREKLREPGSPNPMQCQAVYFSHCSPSSLFLKP